jgi:hypothetical protein
MEVETKCPICNEPVIKTITTQREELKSKCYNEYYVHIGNNLYKHKNPIGSWETNPDILLNSESQTTPVISGQNTDAGIQNQNP